MIRLADVISLHRNDLITQYTDQLLPSHHRALDAIVQCRTSAIGTTTWRCDNCRHVKTIALSCGNRHCPTCQNHESTDWLDRQIDKSLPVEYFMVTFTLPAQLRHTMFSHQKTLYTLFFDVAIDTLKSFGLTTKRLHGQLGMTAVLHTHNRKLDYHPHIHVLIPALAIHPSKNQFQRCRGKYLFNVRSLAKVYRARFLQAINKTDIPLPVGVPSQWNVHCQPAGRGKESLQYLARYLYRGVIDEHRILSCHNGMVEFEYLCSSTKQYKRRTLPAAQFLWKVLMHVLPRGFQRTRCYGFLHHNCRVLLKRIQLMLQVVLPPVKSGATKTTAVACPKCRQPMSLVDIWRAPRCKPLRESVRGSPLIKEVTHLISD